MALRLARDTQSRLKTLNAMKHNDTRQHRSQTFFILNG